MAAADTSVAILGIRHHGPGSARSVRRALEQLAPVAVVIEGPPELDGVVALAGSDQMEPPVAGLVYDPSEPRKASFYPMASFSPEWVALRWAIEHGATVRFADLPAANFLADEPDADSSLDLGSPDPTPVDSDEPADGPVVGLTREQMSDPLGALAAAAGYDDAERWWEDAIEQRTAGDDVLGRFTAVRAAMAELRAPGSVALLPDRERLLRREAAMRKVLRDVIKTHDGPVVFVCGAFHAPVLHPDDWPTQASDNALLKGLPRTKVAATWAPWTSARLAYASGYGAGVTAPGWYAHLFDGGDDVIASWMVRVSRLLREQGFPASAATAVDATRLAETLASLRGRPLAGLSEVDDAARTVFAGGSDLPLRTIAQRLLVGDAMGSVPDDTPMVPLAEDLARQQRSLRLKPSAEAKTVTLDLRQDGQLARSVLFWRLRLLGIGWASQVDVGRTTGTFKEAWQLEWQPELAIAVIEASLYGTTIVTAAAAKVVEDAQHTDDLAALARMVEACLPADLPDAMRQVLDVLARRTAHQADHLALMLAVEPLARTRRYGDVRGVDTQVVHTALEAIVARVAIGLASACASLDDDAAAQMRGAIESVDRGVSLTTDEHLSELWRDAMARLSTDGVHGSVAGRVSRILLDAGRIDAAESGRRLSRALSLASDPSMAAAWLDGFLAGDVALLLHDPVIFGVIDTWVSGLDDEVFDDLLPLVRRTFARFEPGERRQVGTMVSSGGAVARAADDPDLDLVRGAPAIAKMAELLGLELVRPQLAESEVVS